MFSRSLIIKAFKLFVFLAALFGLFLLVSFLAFYHLLSVGEFRRFLIDEIEQNTKFKVQLGEARLEVGRILGVGFHDLALSEPDAVAPVITAERITARVALMPLLRRKLVFYEIRLNQPGAQVVRDKNGKIPLLDRLLNLPFVKSAERQFAFDLRALKITGAKIDFLDHFLEGTARSARLENLDLDLARLRGAALRDFFQSLVRGKRDQPQGAALEFELKTAVAAEGKEARLRAKGTMIFPNEPLEIDQAWWNADAQITDLPAPLVQSYAGSRLPVNSLSGTLAGRFYLEGNPKQRLQAKGEISFKQLVIDAPEFFPAPLSPGDGRLDLDVSWQPRLPGGGQAQQWELSRVNLRSKDLQLALTGALRVADSEAPQLQLIMTAPPLAVAAIKKYLPPKWIAAAHAERFVAALQFGNVKLNRVEINARLSDLRAQIAKGGFADAVSLDVEFMDIAANPAGGYPPLRGFQGKAILETGLLSFKEISGDFGQSRLANIDGTYRWFGADQGALHLRARGEADFGELREQAQQGLLPAQVAKAAAAIQEMAGRGSFDLAVNRAAESVPLIEGRISLDGARIKLHDFPLTDVRGEIALTPAEIKTEKVRAVLSGSPVQIQMALKDYADDNGTFDLTVESAGIRAGVVTRWLLSSGSLQDHGMVRGSVRYRGALGTTEGRKLTGNLDLADVQLAVRPLLQPLRELHGRISIDETGIDFQNLKGLLVGLPAGLNGRWRFAQKPQLLFDFTAPNLDVGYFYSQLNPEAADFYANLQGAGKITLGQGRIRAFQFSDLKADVVIDRKVWRLGNIVARSSGGSLQGSAIFTDQPGILGISVEPRIKGVPVQGVLDWFEAGKAEMTGKVDLTGKLAWMGKDAAERKRSVEGSFNLRIEDGTIGRMRVLVQLLNLLDLSRWFTLQAPDLGKQGIRFRAITGDFRVTQGIYATENLVVDSDDLRMTGQGKIDLAKDEIDFIVAVRPFAGIDTVIGYIPLIGRSIAAIKNSFLVGSFNIRGPIDDPTITPAPLGTLSEWFWGVLGIPKNIIGLSSEEKKDAALQEPSNEPIKESAPLPAQ
ncbi:MAG TPA: AsmA-like C-terminal domain-containing protein [Candidatus Binatia bacterium]|nr:AsmA-like C-terminal domain-containing protein [Candidatus Binatia bacterium]